MRSPRKKPSKTFKIGGNSVDFGERKYFTIGKSSLYDNTDIGIPVEVVRGQKDGPVLFITAAIHGDEINGFEIIRKLLKRKELKDLKGTLIAVPIVNVFGFNTKSRYLPDRRDLNRAFPGSKNGSLASRMAYTLMKEVVKKSDFGIDLHTGAIHRENLPQIRAHIDNPETLKLAKAFDAPLILNSKLRDGSLREAARKRKTPILLYEGGEALRFDNKSIQVGLKGCLNVMRTLKMIPKDTATAKKGQRKKHFAESSHWLRAPRGGCLRLKKSLGQHVKEGEVLGLVSGPFDQYQEEFCAIADGIVIGVTNIPLVNRGDAVIHIATPENLSQDKNIDGLD